MNKIIQLIFVTFLISLGSCANNPNPKINKQLTSEVNVNSSSFKSYETILLLSKTIGSEGIILDYNKISNKDKIKYVRKELISGDEFDSFRLKMKKLKFLFSDTNQIELFIEQSKSKVDTVLNETIFDRFTIDKEQFKLISKEVDFKTPNYNNDILYKISYPMYTKSGLSALILTQCIVNGIEKEWISIFDINENEEWNLGLVMGLGKDNAFGIEYSTTPSEE